MTDIDFNPINWAYRGEGNRNLVIENNQTHTVIRLIKKETCLSPVAKRRKGNEKEKLENEVEYVKAVLIPMLGNDFITPAVVTDIPEEFLEDMQKKVQAVRPEWRKSKELDPCMNYGLCMTDYCYLTTSKHAPTYCIEIKPKTGFLPDITTKEHAIKHSVCRFCMFQRLKVHNGKWKQLSQYCPLDLFSGSPDRMHHALKMLLNTPQNNLRIFKNGKLIYDDHLKDNLGSVLENFDICFPDTEGNYGSSGLDNLVSIVSKCLLSRTGKPDFLHDNYIKTRLSSVAFKPQTCKASTHTPNKQDVNSSSLTTDCVLGRLLLGQKLGSLDIEGTYPHYLKVMQKARCHLEMPGLEINNNYNEFWPETPPTDQSSYEYSLLKLKEYLVSRTVKDCSIMVTFQPTQSSANDSRSNTPPRHVTTEDLSCHGNQCLDTDLHGNRYQFRVSLIDLDPKPMSKMDKYYSEEDEIVQFYLKSLEDEKKRRNGLENGEMENSLDDGLMKEIVVRQKSANQIVETMRNNVIDTCDVSDTNGNGTCNANGGSDVGNDIVCGCNGQSTSQGQEMAKCTEVKPRICSKGQIPETKVNQCLGGNGKAGQGQIDLCNDHSTCVSKKRVVNGDLICNGACRDSRKACLRNGVC